jgi:hypothetical protein
MHTALLSEWRTLALHWATHAQDPDLSLTSLRVFALLAQPLEGYAPCRPLPVPPTALAAHLAPFSLSALAARGLSFTACRSPLFSPSALAAYRRSAHSTLHPTTP